MRAAPVMLERANAPAPSGNLRWRQDEMRAGALLPAKASGPFGITSQRCFGSRYLGSRTFRLTLNASATSAPPHLTLR